MPRKRCCNLCFLSLKNGTCTACQLVNSLLIQKYEQVSSILNRDPAMTGKEFWVPAHRLNLTPFDSRQKQIEGGLFTPFEIIMRSALPSSTETEQLLLSLFSSGFSLSEQQLAWYQSITDHSAWWSTVAELRKFNEHCYRREIVKWSTFLPYILVTLTINYVF